MQPAPLWTINFFPPATRPIFSSTAINTPIAFNWPSLSGPQQAALGSSLVLDYLRGDQSKELRFPGGVFRNRTTTILGDIVNSTPLYSKAADHGYMRKPAASVVLPVATATQGSSLYHALCDRQADDPSAGRDFRRQRRHVARAERSGSAGSRRWPRDFRLCAALAVFQSAAS